MARKIKVPTGSCLNLNLNTKLSYVSIEIILIIIVIFAAVYLVYKHHRNFINKEQFTEHLPSLSMYYTDWCGHSRRMLPIFDSLSDAYAGRLEFIKYDCDDRESGKAQCAENSIRFLPTLLFRKTPHSEPVKYDGGANIEILTEFINNQLAGQ
jgi:thiol-disulfide isomerase/thioredoxin